MIHASIRIGSTDVAVEGIVADPGDNLLTGDHITVERAYLQRDNIWDVVLTFEELERAKLALLTAWELDNP